MYEREMDTNRSQDPTMNSRQRFFQTMSYGTPDRVPYFEEGIREEVRQVWLTQGLPPDVDLAELFPCDRREELEPDLEPRPRPIVWPESLKDLNEFQRKLDPNDPARFPADWSGRQPSWRTRDHVLLLRVHRGFFLSMGVDGWARFRKVIRLLYRDPGVLREAMRMQGEFAAVLAERVVKDIEVDAAIFIEPIGENHGPLISPAMYDDIVLRSYEPVLQVLRQYQVHFIIFMTFANTRLLLPGILKRGFNSLWACEVNVEEMDYRRLRHEFGRDLRLIGGIDLDALRHGKEAIRREILEKVPYLLEEGGYVPLADGRVREDVSYENYRYYRTLLQELTASEDMSGV